MDRYTKKKIENLLGRIEKKKIEKKKELNEIFPILGLYDMHTEDYEKLMFLLDVAFEYCRRRGVKFDLKVLPEQIRRPIRRVLLLGHNKWVNTSLTSSEKLFFAIDVEKDVYLDKDLPVLVDDWFGIEQYPTILITGLRGYGKTDFSLRIAECLMDNFEIACNFRTDSFKTITKSSEFLKWVAKNWNKKKLFILDEAMLNVDARRSMSHENVGLSHFLAISRKLRVAMIGITQFEHHVDLRLRDFATVFITKTSKVRAEVEIPLRGEEYVIRNIRRTSIGYDTTDLGLFEFDIIFDDYYDYINRGDIEGLMRELDKVVAVAENSNKSIIEDFINRFLIEHEEFNRWEVVEYYGCSIQHVTNMLKRAKMKGLVEPLGDGRYRSLVYGKRDKD